MKKALSIVLGIILIFIIMSLVGPSQIKVERELKMNHSPDRIFEQLNSFPNWVNWSPWYSLDTNAVYTYSGEPGEGSSATWQSEVSEVGNGSETIKKSERASHIQVEMTFESQGNALAYFDLTPIDSVQTNVLWGFEMDVPFWGRAILLFIDMEEMLGPMYTQGLNNLDLFLNDKDKEDELLALSEAAELVIPDSIQDVQVIENSTAPKKVIKVESLLKQEETVEKKSLVPMEEEKELQTDYAFINNTLGKITVQPTDVDLMNRAFEEVVIKKLNKGNCAEKQLGNDVILENLNNSQSIITHVRIDWKTESQEKKVLFRRYEIGPSTKSQIGCSLSETSNKGKVKWRIVDVHYTN